MCDLCLIERLLYMPKKGQVHKQCTKTHREQLQQPKKKNKRERISNTQQQQEPETVTRERVGERAHTDTTSVFFLSHLRGVNTVLSCYTLEEMPY